MTVPCVQLPLFICSQVLRCTAATVVPLRVATRGAWRAQPESGTHMGCQGLIGRQSATLATIRRLSAQPSQLFTTLATRSVVRLATRSRREGTDGMSGPLPTVRWLPVLTLLGCRCSLTARNSHGAPAAFSMPISGSTGVIPQRALHQRAPLLCVLSQRQAIVRGQEEGAACVAVREL